MYELFILSEIFDHDIDGYRLKYILENRVGHKRKVSYGSLYPQLDKLEKNGLIELIKEDNNPRSRKTAHITAKGRERFFELMMEPVPINGNLDFTYEFKFGSLRFLSAKQQIQILEEYATFQRNTIQHNQQVAKEMPNYDFMSESDKKDTQRVTELRIAQSQAGLDWANKIINEVSKDARSTK